MTSQGRTAITFTLSGRRYELTRTDVESRLASVAPDAIRKHTVRVNDIWFPGHPGLRGGHRDSAVRVHLTRVRGRRRCRAAHQHPWTGASTASAAGRSLDEVSAAPAPISEEWHTEANVQAFLVTALVSDGWRILSVANTATKEHGIDVIAGGDGQAVGVEVKGFPSRGYADPTRSGEVKRTSSSTQAGHWYSQAVLAAMRLRGKEPEWLSVIALPDFPRYRELYAETSGSLAAAQIAVWWLSQDGIVHT
jgi:hypothetical protein